MVDTATVAELSIYPVVIAEKTADRLLSVVIFFLSLR